MSTASHYHHGDLPASLRRAAWDLIDEKGARALSMRECARRAGVSHAAPAHHFGSLSGLLAEVAADGYARMVEQLDGAVAGARRGDRVTACGLAYIAFAQRWPHHFRLMLGEPIDATANARLRANSAAALQRLRDAIAHMWLARHGSAPSARILDDRTTLGWSCAHGYASLTVDHRTVNLELPPAKPLLERLTKALLEP